MHKAKALYGHMVCGKCYYGFANRRQFAFFLDSVALGLLMFSAAFIIVTPMVLTGFPPTTLMRVNAALQLAYYPIFFCKDAFSGYSLGKAICGVRVMDASTGAPGGVIASFKRNLPLLIPFMPLVVAVRLGKGPRTGDGWANSMVVWDKYSGSPVFAPTKRA